MVCGSNLHYNQLDRVFGRSEAEEGIRHVCRSPEFIRLDETTAKQLAWLPISVSQTHSELAERSNANLEAQGSTQAPAGLFRLIMGAVVRPGRKLRDKAIGCAQPL